MSFITELKRRNVFKVGVAYAVVAWLLIQIASILFQTFHLPDWVMQTFILIVMLGFPIALVLAWAYELTPDGIKQTLPNALSQTKHQKIIQNLALAMVICMTLVISVFLLINNVNRNNTQINKTKSDTSSLEVSTSTTSSDSIKQQTKQDVLPNSIAVLPFENMSPNPNDVYFTEGMHEEILNQLSKIKNLMVIARTTMQQYAKTNKPIKEIAKELKVKTVMEGSVRFDNGRVRVTSQLIDPVSGANLWSDAYNRDLKDTFAIQSDIAMNVANAMQAEFSPAEQARIEEKPTSSPDAYRLYLEARALLLRYTRKDILLGIDRINQALELDPKFALGWALKSRLYDSAQAFVPEHINEEYSEGVQAARHAVELAPNLPEGHLALAGILSNRGDWLEAETQNSIGAELGGKIPPVMKWALGYLKDSKQPLLEQYELDPLNSTANFQLFVLYEQLGDSDASDATYEKGSQLYPQWIVGNFNRWEIFLGRGDIKRANEILISQTKFWGSKSFQKYLSSIFNSKDNLAQRIQEFDTITAKANILVRAHVAVVAAYYGQQQIALKAMSDHVNGFATGSFYFWTPLFKEVRKLNGFKEYMRKKGFVAYWQKYGWPDLCKPVGKDDFECH